MFKPKMSGDQRMLAWRNARHRLKETAAPLEQVLAEFADIRLNTRCIDYYTPESWPSAFEIVHQGWLDQSGLTIVLASTLAYLGFIKTVEVVLPVISNHISGAEGLVLELEHQFCNFVQGRAVSRDFANENGTVFFVHTLPSILLSR